MNTITKKSEFCEDCYSKLEGYIWYCSSCEKWLCDDCGSNKSHNDHELLFYKSLDKNTAKVITLPLIAAAGESSRKWPSTDINWFLDSQDKCSHCMDYFKNKGNTFYCQKCHTWLCEDCLKDHEDHGILPHISIENGEMLRVIYPSGYRFGIDSKQKGPSEAHEGENVAITLEIHNKNKKTSISDIVVRVSAIIRNDTRSIQFAPITDINKLKRNIEELSKNLITPTSYYSMEVNKFKILKPTEKKEIHFQIRIPKKEEIGIDFSHIILFTPIDFRYMSCEEGSCSPNDLDIQIVGE